MIKAVILGAGNGTRMRPLTENRPKPLLRVVEKTILEHNLDQLDGLVKEVIIIIGYNAEMIKSKIGDSYGGISIRYVIQDNPKGTGDAARRAVEFIDDEFILLNGDDLYLRSDIERSIQRCPSILLGSVDNPSSFGVVECNNEVVTGLVEKPENPLSGSLVNTGLYFLNKSIFDFDIEKSPRGEYEFTDYIKRLITKESLYFQKAKRWIPVSYPWNLLQANQLFLNGLERSISGRVGSDCSIIGNVTIEEGAIIKSGARIEGPTLVRSGSIIETGTLIRRSIIGDNSHIGSQVKIECSYLGDGVNIFDNSSIMDSIIGDNCRIGANTITSNSTSDGKTIMVKIKDRMIDSGKVKLGSIIGDNSVIKDNSLISPGSVIKSEGS